MSRRSLAVWLVLLVTVPLVITSARAGEVAGQVTMPDVCSPAISPAVVTLAPAVRESSAPARGEGPGIATAEVALIDQQGLQFTPRVQAIALGQTVRFTNHDTETHNVHVGNQLNVSMSPGQGSSFTPDRPGVYTILCDIHGHMRGYLVVGPTPWVRVCSRAGRFRLDGVPDGPDVLTVWQEMGTPLRTEVVVADGRSVDLGTLALTVPSAPATVAGAVEPPRPWARVVEKIGILLASSLDAAGRPGGLKPA